jgi:hypothetical protein
MPLLSFMTSNPDAVRQLTIEQIVSNAGDGRLRDSSECQNELRSYLRLVSTNQLGSYASHCLSESFQKSGQVLQDIVNELGRRLEYEVINGRYQGTQNEVGNDGLWCDPTGHKLVVEVKTTDTYRLALETVIGYRDQLLARGTISHPCSVLIVVGRTDTGELEAQVRGSKYAWDIRLISVDSLLNLVRTKENADSEQTIAKIRRLLTPLEYTRLDSLVDVIFTTAHDVETSVSTESIDQTPDTGDQGSNQRENRFQFTPSDVIQATRERIVIAIGKKLGWTFVKKSRALYWTVDGNSRIACTISKRYAEQGSMKYWYAYHPQWSDFLRGSEHSYFALGCVDLNIAFVIPENLIYEHLTDFNTTERGDGDKYYHIKILENASGKYVLELPHVHQDLPLEQFQVQLVSEKS